MIAPYIKVSLNEDGDWQAFFAFLVLHQKTEEWLKMKWGFNTGVLLEEALDRGKLFIESQTLNETEHYRDAVFEQSLALRIINFPETGIQTALIGKVSAPVKGESEIQKAGQIFAREVYATFPYDFILKPAKREEDFNRLFGSDILNKNLNTAQIQRGNISSQDTIYIPALWQASSRSNEQIWRSLSATSKILLNITIKPSFFSAKNFYLEQKKKRISENREPDPLLDRIVERRLTKLQKYFLLQVHLLSNELIDKNLLHTIGTSLTRDTSDTLLPGYRVLRDIPTKWHKKILEMDLLNISNQRDDLADIEETHAVFRLPHPPASGLIGVFFINEF